MMEEAKKNPRWLKTGSVLLDILVGGGVGLGFPTGKVINFVGDKSSGKTFIACEIVAANHHRYGDRFRWNYDDGESGFTFDGKKLWGVDVLNKENAFTSSQIEEFDVNTKRFLKKKMTGKAELGLYVIDSLDGLSDAEKEDRAEKRYKAAETGNKGSGPDGTYGTLTPKFLSQEFFRTKTDDFAEQNASLLIISQTREKLNAGLFEKKQQRSGGKALDFYAHSVVWLSNICKIRRGDRVVGVFIEAYLDKSKTPRPYRKIKLLVYFDYGIDDIGSSLNYLYDCWGEDGKLKKTRAIAWEGGKDKNLTNLKEFLKARDLTAECREAKKEADGKPQLSIDFMIDWIEKQEGEVAAAFKDEFGETVDYEDLCVQISEDPKMKKELDRRVIEKWEAEEAAVATKRRGKYS